MSNKPTKNLIAPFLGLVWSVVVTLTYYVANAAYYQEKFSQFGGFFMGFLS